MSDTASRRVQMARKIYTEDDARRFMDGAAKRALSRHRRSVEAEVLRIGSRTEPKRSSQLGLLLSIPSFAQEAKRIPQSDGVVSGVTADGVVVCCSGSRTPLELGSLVECAGGCGRYFTGTADKAFAVGPWDDEE
jgi:hypothetical protein